MLVLCERCIYIWISIDCNRFEFPISMYRYSSTHYYPPSKQISLGLWNQVCMLPYPFIRTSALICYKPLNIIFCNIYTSVSYLGHKFRMMLILGISTFLEITYKDAVSFTLPLKIGQIQYFSCVYMLLPVPVKFFNF